MAGLAGVLTGRAAVALLLSAILGVMLALALVLVWGVSSLVVALLLMGRSAVSGLARRRR